MEEVVKELERTLGLVNEKLRTLLPKVSDPETKAALVEVERMSRWRREEFVANAYELAFARARKKAEEYGEPVVVFHALERSKLVISTRKRFDQEKPFGAGQDDIVFETGAATHGAGK